MECLPGKTLRDILSEPPSREELLAPEVLGGEPSIGGVLRNLRAIGDPPAIAAVQGHARAGDLPPRLHRAQSAVPDEVASETRTPGNRRRATPCTTPPPGVRALRANLAFVHNG